MWCLLCVSKLKITWCVKTSTFNATWKKNEKLFFSWVDAGFISIYISHNILTSIYIIVVLIIIICSRMLFECFLMRDLIIVVNMLVTLLRVLVKVNMVLGTWEIWTALRLFLNEYATSRRWIRLYASEIKLCIFSRV